MDHNSINQSEIKQTYNCPLYGVENEFVVNQSELLFGGKSSEKSQLPTQQLGRVREPVIYILKCTNCKRQVRVEIE